MEKLLPYYEPELSMLRRAGADFAERYPKLARILRMFDADHLLPGCIPHRQPVPAAGHADPYHPHMQQLPADGR